MRTFMLSVSMLALVACGEQAATEAAAPTPPMPDAASLAPVDVTNANDLTPEQISARLVGEFRSTQDELAGLIITSAGKWTETYQNEEPSMEVNWRVFTGDQAPTGTDVTFTPASRYLELKAEDGASYYELGHVGEDAFDMFYTGRGNRLSFQRVKAPA